MQVLTLFTAQFILSCTVNFVLFFLSSSPSPPQTRLFPLLPPCAEIPRRPVTLTGALAASLPGALLCLTVFLQHALVFPPQLVIAPHSLAVLFHMWQVWRSDQLHYILEPCTWLADLAWWAGPAVSITGHPGPVASSGAIFEWVRETGVVTCHELVHSLPLEDFEGKAGKGLCEAMLLGMADVHAFILAEETTEQEALLCWHHAIVQLHLREAEGESTYSEFLHMIEQHVKLQI